MQSGNHNYGGYGGDRSKSSNQDGFRRIPDSRGWQDNHDGSQTPGDLTQFESFTKLIISKNESNHYKKFPHVLCTTNVQSK